MRTSSRSKCQPYKIKVVITLYSDNTTHFHAQLSADTKVIKMKVVNQDITKMKVKVTTVIDMFPEASTLPALET